MIGDPVDEFFGVVYIALWFCGAVLSVSWRIGVFEILTPDRAQIRRFMIKTIFVLVVLGLLTFGLQILLEYMRK